MAFEQLAQWVVVGLGAAGILAIALGALGSTGVFLYRLIQRAPVGRAYDDYRQHLGRAILLGLEFLVASDIVQTAVIDLSFRSLGVLAGIVLVRTFLSFTLELEVTGRWPWQKELRPRARD